MPTGTVRYWAAARAAAGCADEPYDAGTLAEALDAARAAHGAELARVLQRCSFVVDGNPVGGRAHDAVALTADGTIEVLPPFAGGSADHPSAEEAELAAASAARTARVFGPAAGVVAAALAGLALLGPAPLAAGLFVVQVVVVLAWLAALDVPGSGGVFVLLVAAAGVMDGVVGTAGEADIGRAAGVAGVGVVVGLLYQLARRPRVDVTLSFGGNLAGLAVTLAAASYLALSVESDGDIAIAAALFGVGGCLVVARLVDLLLPRPAALPGSRRGGIGVVVGLAAAALFGWACGSAAAAIGTGAAVRLALIGALVATVADLAVDAVLSAAPPKDARARSALPPLGLLLPVALAGPAAYVAGRILLG